MNLALLMQNAHPHRVDGNDPRLLTEDDRIVHALRNTPTLPNEDRAQSVELVTKLMLETSSNKVRNAAAIFLTDVLGKAAAENIVRVLKRPGLAKAAGSLLFSLNDVEARLPLDLILDMIEQGSLEAQGEALTFLEDCRVDPFDAEQFAVAKARLSACLNNPASPAVAHAAEIALEYLNGLTPEAGQMS